MNQTTMWPISRWPLELTVLFCKQHHAQAVHAWDSHLKALAPWSAKGNLFFEIWIHPLPRVASFLNKAIFPFTQQLSLSIGFLSDEQLTVLFETWGFMVVFVSEKGVD